MFYCPDQFQRGKQVNIQDAFAEWYHDKSPNRDFRGFYELGDAHALNPRLFTEFLQDIRLQFCRACPDSLVEQATLTFGGGDGGGGLLYTGVQAEHMDRALSIPQHAAIVAPLT